MRADRQSRFLRHIVERSLEGDEESLRETVIGLTVYGRPGDYDPKSDSIVRVEASRLRGRLREYYEAEGVGERVRIQIPKGTYVPAYEWNGGAPEGEAEGHAGGTTLDTPRDRPGGRRWGRVATWLTLALAVSAVSAYLFYFKDRSKTVRQIESIAVLPFTDFFREARSNSLVRRAHGTDPGRVDAGSRVASCWEYKRRASGG